MAPLKTAIAAATFLLVALPAPSTSASPPADRCAAWGDAKRLGELENAAITESSGLAASRRHEGLWWTHNDSGDDPRLFLLKPDGSHVAEVSLEGAAQPKDWEDMAVGPCEEGAKESCVYVADIGDNNRKRERVVVHRFPEPALPDDLPASVEVDSVDAIWFTYPGGARDAESLMVHPETAQLYVVEKSSAAKSKVFRLPNEPASQKKAHQADEVGELAFESMGGFGKMVTAGDIAPDGREFSVRTYVGVYTFCVAADEDFEDAFSTEPAAGRAPFMVQSEALGYAADGGSLLVTSEGRPSPLVRMQRVAKETAPDSD